MNKYPINDRYRDENGRWHQIPLDLNSRFLYVDDSDFELPLKDFLKKHPRCSVCDYYSQRFIRGIDE